MTRRFRDFVPPATRVMEKGHIQPAPPPLHYSSLLTEKRSIWFRNVQLACFSLPVAVMCTVWRDVERFSTSEDLFQGYDSVVLLVIVLQAVGGLVVAAGLRYAGNILKCFAVSISICNCAVATAAFFNDGHGLSTGEIFGIALVISSTFLYSNAVWYVGSKYSI